MWSYSGQISSFVKPGATRSSHKEWRMYQGWPLFVIVVIIYPRSSITKSLISFLYGRNWFLNFGLVFETCLAALLSYTPGMSNGLRMYPLAWVLYSSTNLANRLNLNLLVKWCIKRVHSPFNTVTLAFKFKIYFDIFLTFIIIKTLLTLFRCRTTSKSSHIIH